MQVISWLYMVPVTNQVSVEDYLTASHRPNCEYEDGVLHPKPMPTWDHSIIQARLILLLMQHAPSLIAAPEVTVHVRPGKFLVPDVVAQHRDQIQRPYPTEAVALCVEILSPDDRMSEVLAKCEEYHRWGVPTTWIVDPESRRAWIYRRTERLTEVPAAAGSLESDGGVSISLASLFSALD